MGWKMGRVNGGEKGERLWGGRRGWLNGEKKGELWVEKGGGL